MQTHQRFASVAAATLQTFDRFISFAAKQLKTVAEVCNPGRFSSQTDHFGCRSGQAFDLELGWNLLDPKQQRSVLDYIRTERPGLTVISPAMYQIQYMLLNLSWPKWYSYNNPQKFDQHIRELRDAKGLLKFCAQVCELCRSLGLSFLFEHPWSASSWKENHVYKHSYQKKIVTWQEVISVCLG